MGNTSLVADSIEMMEESTTLQNSLQQNEQVQFTELKNVDMERCTVESHSDSHLSQPKQSHSTSITTSMSFALCIHLVCVCVCVCVCVHLCNCMYVVYVSYNSYFIVTNSF